MICIECGNDDAAEGQSMCSDCLGDSSVTYRTSAATTTSVSVFPSVAALATAAFHRSPGMRSERGMVAMSANRLLLEGGLAVHENSSGRCVSTVCAHLYLHVNPLTVTPSTKEKAA